ncbi:MAG: DinB family protein [Candidatus Nanopelagicaceae bacterium]|nr:DinB family protein [Candidatus Nanopelagicaceae bacterium]
MSQEVFAQYAEDVSRVQEFYNTFSFSLDKVPADGGWTASQCLAHICDAEISLSLRIRMILTTENYQFSSWDEDAFAAIKVNRDSRTSVETFSALRQNNLDLLSGLNDSQLQKTGIKANGEPISLIDYVGYMTTHVRNHIDQAVSASK